MIDMANHHSSKATANVAFEYFGNAYSLATTTTKHVDTDAVSKQQQQQPQPLYISYGDRSNDQLLQYYGFVESDNPHDVYLLPPISDWNLAVLEAKCGRTVPPGRLAQLATAIQYQLSSSSSSVDTTDDDDLTMTTASTPAGYVVLTRAKGLDPSALQLIRALFATEDEWNAAGKSIAKFQNVVNRSNEACVQTVVKTMLTMELESKPTTIEQDEQLLLSTTQARELRLAIRFRMEKKKLLKEALEALPIQ
jgi:Rubisco LSMT substrate-binding